MVFCNTLGSCRATEHYLREKDVHTLCYHGDVPLDGRRQAIQEFTSEPSMDGQPVLVCTDLAARCVSNSDDASHLPNSRECCRALCWQQWCTSHALCAGEVDCGDRQHPAGMYTTTVAAQSTDCHTIMHD